jgi:hypothetical protein
LPQAYLPSMELRTKKRRTSRPTTISMPQP